MLTRCCDDVAKHAAEISQSSTGFVRKALCGTTVTPSIESCLKKRAAARAFVRKALSVLS